MYREGGRWAELCVRPVMNGEGGRSRPFRPLGPSVATEAAAPWPTLGLGASAASLSARSLFALSASIRCGVHTGLAERLYGGRREGDLVFRPPP